MKNKITLKILILDDEPFMHKLLVRMLAILGYNSVSTCDNGHTALELRAAIANGDWSTITNPRWRSPPAV